MQRMRRVVITGMGAVSPLGLDVPTLWQGIIGGQSGISPITLFDSEGFDTRFAGEVKGFDAVNYMDKKETQRTDRFVHMGLAAVQEALRSSELTITHDNCTDVGVFIGSGIGGLETLTRQIDTLKKRGPGRVSPFIIPAMITNIAAGHISIATGARGPNMCHTSACASGAHSIGEAFEAICAGRVNVILAGGCEAPINHMAVAGFNSARAISTRNDTPTTASRPFDKSRDGFVLSEGAAVLVMEDLAHALHRGAPIVAEIIGYGASADAYHITQPPEDGNGAALAMHNALKRAHLAPAEVSYINAHGTSTPAGDIAESNAIKTVFGEHAATIPVSSNKSQFGHLLGAAGPLEAVVSILAMNQGLLPPTINLNEPDPACDLDYVPRTARPGQIEVFMSNSFGFGGHNVSLIFRKIDPAW